MQQTRRRVLEALDDGPISGPDIAEELGVSRAAVWKHIEALREAGFEIGSGEGGYVLTSVPEYGGPAVEFGLEAPFEVEYHEVIGSTNARAREFADEGASNVVVLADRQTEGRGRLDREWTSPAGGVWSSILVRPDLPPSQVPVYTLAAAVATAVAARETGVDARIKWPNDVLVPTEDGEKKLAGILTEMEGEADRVSWVIVGVGVNANVDVTRDGARAGDEAGAGAGDDDRLPYDATSLRNLVGDVDRRAFVQDLLETFDSLRRDPENVVPEWREYAVTLGRRVRVETPSGEIVGEAVDIEFPGTLLVETDEGTVRVTTGDCEHLRPTE